MRNILLALVIMAFGTICLVSGLPASDVPDTITMDSSVYKEHKKSLVTWGHSEHADDFGVECSDCHHKFSGGENVWQEGDPVQKCEACHADPNKPRGKGLSKGQKVGSHYWALHENCRACHQEQESGPVACNDCHPQTRSRWAFTWR